jgi:hypothetical protein
VNPIRRLSVLAAAMLLCPAMARGAEGPAVPVPAAARRAADKLAVPAARQPFMQSAAPPTRPAAAPSTAADHPLGDKVPDGAAKTELVGGPGGEAFVLAKETGEPVLGFNFALGRWKRAFPLRSFEPLYVPPASRMPSSRRRVSLSRV